MFLFRRINVISLSFQFMFHRKKSHHPGFSFCHFSTVSVNVIQVSVISRTIQNKIMSSIVCTVFCVLSVLANNDCTMRQTLFEKDASQLATDIPVSSQPLESCQPLESSQPLEHELITTGADAPADLSSPPERPDSVNGDIQPVKPAVILDQASSTSDHRPPPIRKSVKFESDTVPEDLFAAATDRDKKHTTVY